MLKMRSVGSNGLVLALLAWSACGDGGGGGDSPSEPTRDAGRASSASVDAGGGAASDPITGLINSLFGDAGLSAITSLLGDGGLAGLAGLFGDAGLPGFRDGGFDPSTLCAQAPQFCPDSGAVPIDAGLDAGDADGPDAGDAGAPDAGDAEAPDAGDAEAPDAGDASPEAGSGDDASAPGDGGETDAGD